MRCSVEYPSLFLIHGWFCFSFTILVHNSFQVRYTNTFFSCLASAQFADCMTCLAIQRILFPFEQTIAFSPVHICLSLNMSEYISILRFLHLQSFHPSVLPYTQQSIHGLPTKMVSSTILGGKSDLSSHLSAHIHVCFTLPHKIYTIQFRLHSPVISTEVKKDLYTQIGALRLYR